MKNLNQKGFALAETLIVTVFLMVLFGMIYTSFFPLIGEFEKREVYDDIDGKYSIFWIKRMIESTEYDLNKDVVDKCGFIRFQCKNLSSADSMNMCKSIVKSLQINNCDKEGNNCDIFISKYKLRDTNPSGVYLKDKVEENLLRRDECVKIKNNKCECLETYQNVCTGGDCETQGQKNVFPDGFKTYLFYLPDYSKRSSTGANYRVSAIIHNQKDANNYYSYTTIEVNR